MQHYLSSFLSAVVRGSRSSIRIRGLRSTRTAFKSRSPISLSSTQEFRVPISTSAGFNFLWRRMGDTQSSGLPDTTGMERKNKVKLTDEEWRAKLTPEQYQVCRNHGTERAWTGELLNSKGKGIYQCACCGADLFHSSTKFDSGSGWPSFYDTLKDKDGEGDLPSVDTHTDRSYGMVRTEVLCGKCDSHLGHVFSDGPQPTGLRYCINSVSLKFKRDSGKSSKNEL